jgi:hypothetical protein
MKIELKMLLKIFLQEVKGIRKTNIGDEMHCTHV